MSKSLITKKVQPFIETLTKAKERLNLYKTNKYNFFVQGFIGISYIGPWFKKCSVKTFEEAEQYIKDDPDLYWELYVISSEYSKVGELIDELLVSLRHSDLEYFEITSADLYSIIKISEL